MKGANPSRLLLSLADLPKLSDLEYIGAGDAGWDRLTREHTRDVPAMVERLTRLRLQSLSKFDVSHLATLLPSMSRLQILDLLSTAPLVGSQVCLAVGLPGELLMCKALDVGMVPEGSLIFFHFLCGFGGANLSPLPPYLCIHTCYAPLAPFPCHQLVLR